MRDDNLFFREAALLICSSLNVETALTRLMDYLQKQMSVNGLGLGLYDPEMNIGRILAWVGSGRLKQDADIIPLSKESGDWIRERWDREPQIQIINDIMSEDEEIQKILLNVFPEDSSHIHMDLELEYKRLGILILYSDRKHQFTNLHSHLASLLHDPLAIATSNILQYREISRLSDLLADENRYLRKELRTQSGDQIVGADFGLKNTMEMVFQVSPLNSPVLLIGETGVGKELVANAIHEGSQRKNKPFIKVNCGAIPDSLIDSELFGHEKGAFTGAVSRRRGKFERAHQGTIFLDEIGELPQAAQVRLLRVLQQHEIERVGGSAPIPIDVRIISATHRNLEDMVRAGQFREDLYFRLNVFPIMVPPLRQRTEDIPALVSHFIEKKSRELNIWKPPKLAAGSMERLQAHAWPGNVRELENLVERELIISQVSGDYQMLAFRGVTPMTDTPPIGKSVDQPDTIYPLDDLVRDHIRYVLRHTNGKIEGARGAAELLGTHPSTLRARMRKLGIAFGRKSLQFPSDE
jgi:formate hydrogenlyase transcriptional activator